MNSETIITGCLILVIAFFLFRPQFFNLLNRLARINVHGAKNLHYTDQDVESELPTSSLPVLPKEKILIRIVVSVILSYLINVAPAPLSRTLIDFGNSEFSTGNEKLGTVSYNLALELNNNLQTTVHQCYADDAQKQYKQVIEHCSMAIEINGHYAPAYYTRGLAYYNLMQYDQAIADFTEAASLLPPSWAATDRGRARPVRASAADLVPRRSKNE